MHRTDEYWAGIFDSEGYISVSAPAGRKPALRIGVGSTFPELLEAMREDMGVGTICETTARSQREKGYKRYFAFRVFGDAAVEILKRLRPYLITKASAADLHLSMPAECVSRTDAYWAGLVDGDGTLTLKKSNGVPKPHMRVKMTCYETVKAMHEYFGFGCFYKSAEPGRINRGYKACWSYQVCHRQAAEIARRLRPFLIVKAENADRVLAHYFKEQTA
jgi:hypothetical protein